MADLFSLLEDADQEDDQDDKAPAGAPKNDDLFSLLGNGATHDDETTPTTKPKTKKKKKKSSTKQQKEPATKRAIKPEIEKAADNGDLFSLLEIEDDGASQIPATKPKKKTSTSSSANAQKKQREPATEVKWVKMNDKGTEKDKHIHYIEDDIELNKRSESDEEFVKAVEEAWRAVESSSDDDDDDDDDDEKTTTKSKKKKHVSRDPGAIRAWLVAQGFQKGDLRSAATMNGYLLMTPMGARTPGLMS